ncbi:MAG TPA: hypothetical protein PKD23_10360 [Bellilinea sp.]|jgi:hypothetical protein|nr:hypothetical protein [Bellilinea sp.]
MSNLPALTFFVELDPPELAALFNDEHMIAQLKTMAAHLSIGLKDLSPERAAVIKKLNGLDIPVTAWLLLPHSQGYWFNLDNIDQAERRYEDFLVWTKHFSLKWDRVGLDIEPDIHLVQSYKDGFWSGLKYAASKLFSRKDTGEAAFRYKALVRRIHQDGYVVESYQMPRMQDARNAKSNLLETLVGTVDLPVDEEILMTYSSFERPYGHANVINYGREARALGLGSTGGGVDLEGVADTRPLSWEELEKDLLLAHHLGVKIYVFSLEGCVREGYLDRIMTMNWNQPVDHIPYKGLVTVQQRAVQGALYVFSRPWILVGVLLTLLVFGRKKKH